MHATDEREHERGLFSSHENNSMHMPGEGEAERERELFGSGSGSGWLCFWRRKNVCDG